MTRCSMLTAAYLPGLVDISPLNHLRVITFITSLIRHQSVNYNAPIERILILLGRIKYQTWLLDIN